VKGWPTQVDADTDHFVTVTATDSAGAQVSGSFTLFTIDVNDAPIVVGALFNLVVNEADALPLVRLASVFDDVDPGDVLTVAVAGIPTGSGIVYDAATMLLSGILTQADADASPITVTVTASDRSAASVSTSFVISVTDVNTPPRVVSQPSVLLLTQGVTIASLDVSVFFEDSDGDALVYFVDAFPGGSGSGLTLNAATGKGCACFFFCDVSGDVIHGAHKLKLSIKRMLLSISTGLLSGTPSNADAMGAVATNRVMVSATDGSTPAVLTLLLQIGNVNDGE
jgi:hypothetical protein